MAQDTSSSSAEDHLRDRINAYLASPEAIRHFEEGFAQGGGLASNWFHLFHESRFHESTPPSGPEGVPAGVQAGSPLNQISAQMAAEKAAEREVVCRELGHKWSSVPIQTFDQKAEEYRCQRCDLIKRVMVGPGQPLAHVTIPDEILAGLLMPPAVAPVAPWLCFYCGAGFEDEDSLLDHEDDCAEA